MVPKSFYDENRKVVTDRVMLGILIRIEKNIKKELKRRNMTPKRLSVVSGVSMKTINKLLNPKEYYPYNPHLETLLKISMALGPYVSLSDLVKASR